MFKLVNIAFLKEITPSIAMNALAAIDIGTNTIRMVIMELDADGNVREVLSERTIVRLGEGIHKKRRLLPHRMDQAIATLKEYAHIAREKAGVPVQVVATSAVRRAENRDQFLAKVFAETGLKIRVIPWEEEARLTLEGVFWKIRPNGKRSLIFDIGGGSTEFVLSEGRKILGSSGTSLGVVLLTERFITRHPVDPEEYERLRLHLRSELEYVREELPYGSIDRVIGTAGTVTTLAAIDQDLYPYDPIKIHNVHLSLETIQRIQDDLKSKTLEERLEIRSLERGREDLIISGIAIVLELLEIFQCQGITISEYGLREGIAIDQWKNSGFA